jgi:hypothetical protein
VAVADAGQIAGTLRAWIAEKERSGRVAPPPESARIGLSRQEQFERVDVLLRSIVDGKAGDATPAMLRADPATVEGLRQ